MLNFINWNADPAIFEVFGREIRWYGLFFAASFYFAYIIFQRFFRKEGVPEKHLDKLVIYMAIGTLAGARLGNCFFYEPAYYLAHPLEIFAIWKGGLASHGAAIGLITACWLYSRRVSKRSIFWIMDRVVILVALSGLFIRGGNLTNSEIVGKETDVAWGFIFQRHSDQAYPVFTAKWKGDNVEIQFKPYNQRANLRFNLLRSYNDSTWVSVKDISINKSSEDRTYEVVDRPPRIAKIFYKIILVGPMTETKISNLDSMDTRTGTLIHSLAGKTVFSGRRVGKEIDLKLQVGSQDHGMDLPLQLLRSTDKQTWDLIDMGVASTKSLTPIPHVDENAPDANTHYWVIEEFSGITLVARHPSQVYESLIYFVIFLLMLGLYYRKDGKIQHGLFFGIFMFSVFSVRFILEFFKEYQMDYEWGWALNMGQLLSIPFILIGIFFFVRAIKSKEPIEPTPDYGES